MNHFETGFLFESYDHLFEMIYDKDDTNFDMLMTFIFRGAVSIILAEKDRNATEGLPEGAAPRHSTPS